MLDAWCLELFLPLPLAEASKGVKRRLFGQIRTPNLDLFNLYSPFIAVKNCPCRRLIPMVRKHSVSSHRGNEVDSAPIWPRPATDDGPFPICRIRREENQTSPRTQYAIRPTILDCQRTPERLLRFAFELQTLSFELKVAKPLHSVSSGERSLSFPAPRRELLTPLFLHTQPICQTVHERFFRKERG